MDSNTDKLVDRYLTLTSFLAIIAVIGWWVVAARLDGPRSLNNTWAVWLAVACVSTVAAGTTTVLAGVWEAAGRLRADPTARGGDDPDA